jgi:hypothetical protein
MIFAVGTLLLTLVAGPAVDVKGKWDGTITAQRPDGTTNNDTALLILDQKDTTVTGTVGGNESDQHPITSGTIEGNKLTLLAKHAQNGREYKIELTVEGDEMKGTLSTGERQAQLVAKRRKE